MDYQMGILKTKLNCRFLNKWLYDKKTFFFWFITDTLQLSLTVRTAGNI